MDNTELRRVAITIKLTKAEYQKLKHEAKVQTRSESAQVLHLLRKGIKDLPEVSQE